MVGDISTIMRELAELQDRITALPIDAHDDKLMLMARQDDLRTRAARLADSVDDGCSTQDLLAQLAGLRRQRAAMERQRADHLGTPRSFRPGSFNSGTQSATTPRGRAGNGSALRIEERIRRVRSLLEERGIELR